MQLGELSRTLRVDRRFGVFGLGVARRFLPKGRTASRNQDLLESAMASTLRITEVSGGRSGTLFCGLENVGRKPVLIPTGRNLSAGSRTGSSTPASSSSGRGDRHPGVLHGGGQVELKLAGPGGRGGVPAKLVAVEKASVAASLDAGRKLPQRPGRGLA